MTAIKKTISIDEDVVKEASILNSNFSAIVEAALIEYLHHHRILKAVNSFGKWGERKGNSADFISNLRSKDDREYVTRQNVKKNKKQK
jgi:hypothetical protein